MTATVGAGQVADFVLEMEEGPLYVREFKDEYEAIRAGEHLARAAVSVIARDNPRALGLAGGALLGAVLGSAVSPQKGAAVVGAGVGLLLAAALLVDDE